MSDSPPLRGAVAQPLPTQHGARTELRLLDTADGGARYEVRWFLARSEGEADAVPPAHGLAMVCRSGEVQIEIKAGELPAWVLAFTDKLLRTTARGVQDGRYPRRLTRWRDATD